MKYIMKEIGEMAGDEFYNIDDVEFALIDAIKKDSEDDINLGEDWAQFKTDYTIEDCVIDDYIVTRCK